MFNRNIQPTVIIGHYGNDNLGDESMLMVLLHYINKEKCTVLGLNAKRIKKSHRVNAYSLMSPTSMIAIFKSRTVIFGGGALIKNTSLLKLSPFLLLSKLFGKEIIFFGIDVYPISFFFRMLIRLCMNRSKMICVRNNQSYSILKHIGIRRDIFICEDLAFMLPSIIEHLKYTKEITQKKIIGINLRPSSFADPFDFNKLVDKTKTTLLNMSLEQPLIIRLIPMQPCDEQVLSDFALSIKREENKNINLEWVKHGYDITNALNAFKCCDLVIGMRYHSLVFATIVNVPFIAIPYSLKVETFAKDLKKPILDGNITNEPLYAHDGCKEMNYESAEKYLEILKECIS